MENWKKNEEFLGQIRHLENCLRKKDEDIFKLKQDNQQLFQDS